MIPGTVLTTKGAAHRRAWRALITAIAFATLYVFRGHVEDDLTFVTATGRLITKPQYLRSVRGRMLVVDLLTFEDVAIRDLRKHGGGNARYRHQRAHWRRSVRRTLSHNPSSRKDFRCGFGIRCP